MRFGRCARESNKPQWESNKTKTKTERINNNRPFIRHFSKSVFFDFISIFVCVCLFSATWFIERVWRRIAVHHCSTVTKYECVCVAANAHYNNVSNEAMNFHINETNDNVCALRSPVHSPGSSHIWCIAASIRPSHTHNKARVSFFVRSFVRSFFIALFLFAFNKWVW